MTEKNIKRGKLASAKGFANESRLLAALLERGYNASRVDLPHSTYDLVLEKNPKEILRIQVKTVGGSRTISFVGGIRGGVDREYKSGVKEYVQNTATSDAVVGVESLRKNGDSKVDFYIIPTILVEKINQKSISVNKIPKSKNNWKLLELSRDENFVKESFRDFF